MSFQERVTWLALVVWTVAVLGYGIAIAVLSTSGEGGVLPYQWPMAIAAAAVVGLGIVGSVVMAAAPHIAIAHVVFAALVLAGAGASVLKLVRYRGGL